MLSQRRPSNPLLVAAVLAGLFSIAACSGQIENDPPGGDPAGNQAQDPGPDSWAGGARAPLGVAGKPLVETATGTVIGDELLVRFAGDLTDGDEEAIAGRAGGTIVYRSAATGYRVVRFPTVPATGKGARALLDEPGVTDVAFQHVLRGTGIDTSPTVHLARLQWNLHALQLDPFSNWANATGVTVAVLDTGVAYEDRTDALGTYARAPDLEDVTFLGGYDFINDDPNANDDQGHGTHVAGIIAAKSGIASLAYDAYVLPVKVLDHTNLGTELALAEGIVFAADNDADVINMSLSFPPAYFPSRLMQSAVDYAAQRGVHMVAAAGNHGAGLVAYPAAFRDVVAVGASVLDDDFDPGDDPDDTWEDAFGSLTRAGYSNHSYRIDVVAPGGDIDSDLDADGNPEAVLAQSFPPGGDPTDFGYFFYSGTSQAAASVSGLIAVILAENPELDPFDVRSLLGETAKHHRNRAIDAEVGRGFVRGRTSINKADHPHAGRDRPRFYADVIVTLHDTDEGTVARARVEVLDEEGEPVVCPRVYGQWTGAAFGSVQGLASDRGTIEFESEPLEGIHVVAFQVDGVALGHGPQAEVDRPRGFVRIDSFSLELLSVFGQGIDTSPTGIDTSPFGGEGAGGKVPVKGAGIDTSPTFIPEDPDFAPLVIGFDPALFGADYRPTLLLPNFSWGLSTVPMAVAVDEEWFLKTFKKADERRVVSYGIGIGDSELLLDHTSFPVPVDVDDPSPERVPLIVLTFTSGIDTSPYAPRPAGIDTSPRSLLVDTFYSGLPESLADAYESLLGDWYAEAAGIDTSPVYGDDMPFGLATFERLSRMARRYLEFAPHPAAGPAAYYFSTLSAASLPMAPVPDADGEGLGVVRLP